MKKEKLSDFLHRHDINRVEFYIYCVAAFMAVLWLIHWVLAIIAFNIESNF